MELQVADTGIWLCTTHSFYTTYTGWTVLGELNQLSHSWSLVAPLTIAAAAHINNECVHSENILQRNLG